ncbi:MAG: hypothetical protein AABX49_01230 [Nanoarchaeota archaeon]
MIVHKNWKMDLATILNLHKEVNSLSKKFGDLFDWRILSHPTEKFSLKKVLKDKKFVDYANLNKMDKILIQFLNSKKKILKFLDLKESSSQNLLYIKERGYLDRASHYGYKLNQKGKDYLISKFYIRWCKYKNKISPLQRVVVYRLATYTKILPTMKNFSSKLGFNKLWISYHESGKLILRPLLIERLMENVKSNFKREIEKNLLSEYKIKEAYNALGQNQYNQICKAAKQIHPKLKTKLTKEEYRKYQTIRLKHTKPSEFEKKIIRKFNESSNKFELHPNIADYHFDFALPSEREPKVVIEAISDDWYASNKIEIVRKKLPKNTIFAAILYDDIREGSILLFKKHFDIVCKISDMGTLLNWIGGKMRIKTEIPHISIKVGNKPSNIWQGKAENSVKEILEKSKFKQNIDFYHELPIFLTWKGGKDKFLPDFIFPIKSKTDGILLETTSLTGHKSILRRRIGKIISRFEIYKTIAKLNYRCIAALFIENKDYLKSPELERLKTSPYCDKLLINEQIIKLPRIIREYQNGS